MLETIGDEYCVLARIKIYLLNRHLININYQPEHKKFHLVFHGADILTISDLTYL